MMINRTGVKYGFALMILASLAGYIYYTDFDLVISQIISFGWTFAGVLLLSFLANASGALAWKYCFSGDHNLSLSKLFFIRTIGENISIFNPTNIVAGEASKYHLLRSPSLSQEEKMTSLLLSRVMLIGSQVVIAIGCVLWISSLHGQTLNTLLVLIISLLTIAMLSSRTIKLFSKKEISHPTFFKLLKRATTIGSQARHFMTDQRQKAAIAFSISTIHWACGAAEIWLILYGLGVDIHLLDALVVDTGVVILKSIGGFVPGQVGVEELSNKYMLSLTGIKGTTIWISVSIIRRGKQICWIAVSMIFYTILKKSHSKKEVSYGHTICHS